MLETTKQLLENIRLSGATLRLDGERLLFTAPKGMPETTKRGFLDALRAGKPLVLAYLVAELNPPGTARAATLAACGVTGCGGCYETEMGRLHPPVPDPMFFAWRERMARK